MLILQIVLALVYVILVLNAIYIFIFAVAGHIGTEESLPESKKELDFIIYVPAYKSDSVILNTTQNLLQIDYKPDKFTICVLGDRLQSETIATLQALPIQLVEVNFEKSTKAKSLKAGVEATSKEYDYAVILDVDNQVNPNFLTELSKTLNPDIKILQAHRVALNTNTSMAILDAISEEVNNHIFRKGHRNLGLSAAFIGSGKALDFKFYKSFIQEIEAVGGFDKEMELKLLSRGEVIHYANHILVYDEKVDEAQNFSNQRKRWLSAQLFYLKEHAGSALIQLLRDANADYFDKMLQMALLPRVVLLGITTIFAGLSLFLNLFPNPLYWQITWAITAFSILISIPKKYFNFKTLQAVLYLPVAFLLVFLNLFKLKGANKQFIHTEHRVNTEEEK